MYVADASNRRIQKFSPSGEVLAIWNGGGPRDDTTFQAADAVAVDATGRVYVADSRRRKVYRLLPDGTLDREIAFFQTDLHGLAVGPDGGVWVGEYRGGRIWKLDPDGRPLAVWGSLLQGPGSAASSSLDLNEPTDIAFDPSGRVYLSTEDQARVWRFTPGGVR